MKNTYGWGMRAVGPIAWTLSGLIVASGVLSVVRIWAFSPIEAPVQVAEFLPGGPAGPVRGGGFVSGEVLVESLPVSAQVWATVSVVAAAALWTWVALTVATVAASVRDGAGFTPRLPRALGLLAIAVVVFGMTLQVSEQLAAISLGEALYPPAGSGPQTAPASAFVVEISGWSLPLWVAFALGVLAFVFDRAARLQRDAAGLV